MKLAGLSLVFSLMVATPAAALRCTEWQDMSQQARIGAVQRAFMEMLHRDWPRPYRFASAGGVEQCLGDASGEIRREFDLACEGVRGGTRILNEVLRGHIARCAPSSRYWTAPSQVQSAAN